MVAISNNIFKSEACKHEQLNWSCVQDWRWNIHDKRVWHKREWLLT